MKAVRFAAAVMMASLVVLGSARADTIPELPPSNDNQSNATPIAQLPAIGSLVFSGATSEPGEDTSCGTQPTTIWYAYRSTETTSLNVSTYDANFMHGGSSESGVHVYRKDRSVMTSLGCGETVTFDVQAGAHYLLQFEPGSSSPNSNFFLGRANAGGNDVVAGAVHVLAPPQFQSNVSLAYYNNADGDPKPSCATPLGSFWFARTQPNVSPGAARLDANGFAYIAVYERSSSGALVEQSCATVDFYQSSASVNLIGVPGTTYLIEYGPRDHVPGDDPNTFPADSGNITVG